MQHTQGWPEVASSYQGKNNIAAKERAIKLGAKK
jgi:hypothetical protein